MGLMMASGGPMALNPFLSPTKGRVYSLLFIISLKVVSDAQTRNTSAVMLLADRPSEMILNAV